MLWSLGGAAPSHAARVLVLGHDGRVTARNDPFLPASTPEPVPTGALGARAVGRASAERPIGRVSAHRTVSGELARLLRSRAISAAAYRRYLGSLSAALRAVKRLRGTRAAELQAVIQNLHTVAAAGLLSPSRLPVLFLTLDHNRAWWTTGPMPAPGQRVEFGASQLVWEYYQGQGLELQELGSFGPIDSMYTGGPKFYPRIRALLAELTALAARRGGGIAWEYYFNFDGGVPPWTSAMSQGTAIQALTEAYEAFHDPAYLKLARQALPIFSEGSPLGVRVKARQGSWYLLYSFAPGATVINGFLQSLIGLYDYAKVSGDPQGWRLFRAGDAEARAALPSYDTGAWSLYQPGEEADLNYHTLVTSFLEQLCSRTHTPVYCTTAAHFESYLKTPPALQLLTGGVRAGRAGAVRFSVSKVSRVGITVLRGTTTVFLTSADFTHGVHAFSLPALRPGSYTVRLDATDLAGNYNQISRTVQASG